MFVKKFQKPSKNWWITLAIVLVLTLIFDNLAIWAGFFSYAPERILDIHIGLAPIEDFFYAILVCMLVPLLLTRFASTEKRKS